MSGHCLMTSASSIPDPEPLDEYLQSLVAAVADGTPVNWEDVESRVHRAEHRDFVRKLRALADMAGIGRDADALPASVGEPPTPVDDTDATLGAVLKDG